MKKLLPPFPLLVILVLSIISLIVIHIFNLDFYFADLIYNKHSQWIYKEAWITTQLLHRYAKYALILCYLIFVIWTFISYFKHRIDLYPRIVLMIALLVGTMTVSALKHILNVDCPWDLIQYGGTKPFMSIWAYKSEFSPSSGCFPAAHASAGFTLISTYYYMRLFKPEYKNIALAVTLFIGFGFGLAQQFRGAHFISHDITSLIVCIIVNHIIFSLAFRHKKYRY